MTGSIHIAIDLVRQQILELAKSKKHDVKAWGIDIDNFCKLALSGQSYENCLLHTFKTKKEGKQYGFDRLYNIVVPLYNAEVAQALYDDALQNNNHNAQKLIAETRMNWSKTQNINVNEHDNHINLYDTSTD